jgi:DNA repair protein SbcC/Rad50
MFSAQKPSHAQNPATSRSLEPSSSPVRADVHGPKCWRSFNKAQNDTADVSGRLDAETRRAEKAGGDMAEAAQQAESAQQRLNAAVAPLELVFGQELQNLKEELRIANKVLRDLESGKKEQKLRLETLIEKLTKNEELREQRNQLKRSEALYHELGTLLSADHFQDYMLQSSYRLLAREGSVYFEDLTGGRYSFHSDDDQFSVRDHANGDELRSVSTLSGGESFLASLSLALALAQSIIELSGERGAVALESLFLDEGFSTLDAETLGKVADALPALQKKGRLIGVITHVESLAEQLPSRIEVAKTPSGSYIVQSRTALEVAATTA